MPVRNPHWYNDNEMRDYPLDDKASAYPDVGERLPQDIVTDLRLVYPTILGEYPFLSAVSVTPGAVTVLIQAAATVDNAEDSLAPVASLSLSRDQIEEGRQYRLESQYPGVYGYIVFGSGIQQIYRGRFSSPAQTLLSPRAAARRGPLPIVSMAKLHAATALTGIVKLQGEAPLEVVREFLEIQGLLREAIVIRLAEEDASNAQADTQSLFYRFAGPCGRRVDSRTCGSPEPIEFINTVGPDCDGLITLELQGCALIGQVTDPAMEEGECGIAVECGLGLAEACLPPYLPDAAGLVPGETELVPDDPVPLYFLTSLDSLEAAGNSESVRVVGEYPYRQNFAGARAPGFAVVAGEFLFVDDHRADLPDLPEEPACYASEGVLSASVRNVAVWEGFGDAALDRQVAAELKLVHGPTGCRHNGGLVLNLRPHHRDPGRWVYHLVEIDYDSQELRVARFDGSRAQTLASLSVPRLRRNDWYRLSAKVRDTEGGSVVAEVQLTGISDPALAVRLGPVWLRHYYPDSGRFGLAAHRAWTRFGTFEVDLTE